MNTSCIWHVLRISFTMVKILSVVTPPDSARRLAPWITGPSAVGSEKGIPSSIISAPASAMANTSCLVTSSEGSPQVINGINALITGRFVSFCSRRIISGVSLPCICANPIVPSFKRPATILGSSSTNTPTGWILSSSPSRKALTSSALVLRWLLGKLIINPAKSGRARFT